MLKHVTGKIVEIKREEDILTIALVVNYFTNGNKRLKKFVQLYITNI